MDLPKYISIEVDEDTAAAPTCFDGIRIDKVHNPKNEQFVKSAVDNIRKSLRQNDKLAESNRQRRRTEGEDVVNDFPPSRSSAPPRARRERSGRGHRPSNPAPPPSPPRGPSHPTPIRPALPAKTAPIATSESTIDAARRRVASAERSVASASRALRAVDAEVRTAEERLASIRARRDGFRSRATEEEEELREAREHLKRVEGRSRAAGVDSDGGEPEGMGENGGDPGDHVGEKRARDGVDGDAKRRGRKSRRVGNNKENNGKTRWASGNGRIDGMEEVSSTLVEEQGSVCDRDTNSDPYCESSQPTPAKSANEKRDDLKSRRLSRMMMQEPESNSDSNGLSPPMPRRRSDLVTRKGSEPKPHQPSRMMMMQDQESEPDVKSCDWTPRSKWGNAANNDRRKRTRLKNSLAAKIKKQGATFEKENNGDVFDFPPSCM